MGGFGHRAIVFALAAIAVQAQSFDAAQRFVSQYCAACHSNKAPAGGFSIARIADEAAFRNAPDLWNKVANRVRNHEMPPIGAAAPDLHAREEFVEWVNDKLRTEACAANLTPPPSRVRRLNRTQYSATVRDLLNLHIDAGAALPADGAGGEGFDNAAETLFLSPIHAEKYLDAAKAALNAAFKDPRSRARFLIAQPGPGVSPIDAARTILDGFLPRAFRRPADRSDTALYLALFESALKRGGSFDDSILFALEAVLVSPRFLFRVEPTPIDDYALASRLSYFLWGSMPDSLLFALAESGKLHDPEILQGQVARMLRNAKSFDFAQSFIEQWLRTRDLGQNSQPDVKLYPAWSDLELQGDIRYQPVLFFKEILANDLSLLNLIDSDFTIATRKLQKLYGLSVKPPRPDISQQPQRIELPPGSHRGGLLGMAAILAVSSHPHRTSPVLRGKWTLDAMLGTPPPPPPPGVPSLDETPGATAHTLRDRLGRHRANPACASCHSRIDPLGFALENYDALGKWRSDEAGRPIDAHGELPDGTAFDGPDELKAALLQKKDLVMRNLTRKLLGYALGRGLTVEDSCTVETIVSQVQRGGYRAHALIGGVVSSPQFRYQMEERKKP